MYKPNTQLILNDLWAAAAADKLGFEVETKIKVGLVVSWVKGFNQTPSFTPYEHLEQWRITVTESGPNAAERFLPQGGDTIADYDWRYLVDDILAEGSVGFISVSDAREKFSEYDEETHGRGAVRIIERNNTPFPQFSEVIEP